MRALRGIAAAAALAFAAGCCTVCDCGRAASGDEPNISVFASFVRRVAKERGVTLAEAADMLYDLGVRGFDAGPDDEDLPELAATRLKPINFYFFPKMLGPDNGAADAKRCLDAAERYGVPRVMVVPSNFTRDGDREAEFEKCMSGMKLFVAEAGRRGITITVEDFGGRSNPGSYTKYLKRFLDEIPELRFALDSGNLYYADRAENDDIIQMMHYAKGRIGHIHLKDQTPENHQKYATLGLGGVPNEAVVREMSAQGYDGWYTLENTAAGADTYTDTVRQVAVLKSWLKTPPGAAKPSAK